MTLSNIDLKSRIVFVLQTPKQSTTIFQTKLSLEKSCSMSTQSSLHSLVFVKPRDPPSKASNGLCGCVGVLHVRSSSVIRLNEMRPILCFGSRGLRGRLPAIGSAVCEGSSTTGDFSHCDFSKIIARKRYPYKPNAPWLLCSSSPRLFGLGCGNSELEFRAKARHEMFLHH